MPKILKSHILVRLFGNQRNHQRVKDIGKEWVLANQKYGLMLRGAAVRNNTEEFVHKLAHATERTTHPEYLYPALYSTMTTQWIDNFNGSQVYSILDMLVQLKFNGSDFIMTESMKQSKFTKKKVDDHVGQQRRVLCRLFNRMMSLFGLSLNGATRGTPQSIIRGLSMMSQCHLKWDHIISHRSMLNVSTENSVVLDPLVQIVAHLSCVEIRDLLESLERLGVKWSDLSTTLQESLTSAVFEQATHFTSIQAVDVVYALSLMELPLSELESTNPSFCGAVYRIIASALTEDPEIGDSNMANLVLAALSRMKMTYAQLPVSVKKAIEKCLKEMDEDRLHNMADILSSLQLDHSRLHPHVAAIITQFENEINPSSAPVFVASTLPLGDAKDSEAQLEDKIETTTTSSSSSSGGFGFANLFTTKPSEEEESVCEIEDLIHEELAATYRSGNDKQFIESLKAVLDEVDLNAPTRQKYFSNELLFLRYLSLDYAKRVKAECIPDLMECLVLMKCGYNMMEKKFLWTIVTRFFNDTPREYISETDREFKVFMTFLDSISVYFNQHETLNAFKVLANANVKWTTVPASVQAALWRAVQFNARQIVPKDALMLLDCLERVDLDVEQVFQRDGAAVAEKASKQDHCHELVGGLALSALKAFEMDLRFAIGGHKAAAEVVNYLSKINFSYALMDKNLVEMINTHLSSVLRKRQLIRVYETLNALGKIKFQFDHTKSHLLPLLFEPFADKDGDKIALLNSTLDALCCLNLTFDMLKPDHQTLLKQCLTESLASFAQGDMPQLMKRLESVNMSIQSQQNENVESLSSAAV